MFNANKQMPASSGFIFFTLMNFWRAFELQTKAARFTTTPDGASKQLVAAVRLFAKMCAGAPVALLPDINIALFLPFADDPDIA